MSTIDVFGGGGEVDNQLNMFHNRLLHRLMFSTDYLSESTPLTSQDFSHEFICFFSGNQMGDDGARILAKALQINSKLR